MRARRTDRLAHAYAQAPPAVRRAFDKQVRLLIEHGHRYPSLDAHPWPAHGPDAMQARVNKAWRFFYYIDGDTYVIYHVQPHPKSSQRGR